MTLELTETKRSDTASNIETAYRRRTQRSAELYERARRSMPGGNTRQAGYWEPYPICIERGQGTGVVDADDNEYFDLNFNYTSLVHGHAYPPIGDAVDLARGTAWAANNRHAIELAELLVERIASIDQVRFANSGTEAGLLALLIAREVTGRRKILMARHGYHGALPEFESGTFNHPGPDTLLADYNDLDSFRAVLDEHRDEICGVWIEPVMGAGGIVPGEPEFLHGLKAAADSAGALFVLDEVITLRLGVGGRQQALGLEPDLTMLGKLIGGGFPVGAIGGKRELLEVFDPKASAGVRVFHSGTYNGNPVTTAAGVVSVRELSAERIAAMERLGARLADGLRDAGKRIGMPVAVRHVGSVVQLFLSEKIPTSSMARSDGELIGRFHLAAVNHGLLPAPRGMMVVATTTTERDIDEICERAAAALGDVANEAD